MSAPLVSNSRSNLNGWNGSVEGKVLPFVGLVADFSGHYGSVPLAVNPTCTAVIGGTCSTLSASTNIYSFLFGPRVSVSVGKIRPFAHALIGAAHMSESSSLLSGSDTSFAYALGGGLDYHLIPLISWRARRLPANPFLQQHAEQCPHLNRNRGSFLARNKNEHLVI
jgi:opacity protein-like surface antigen